MAVKRDNLHFTFREVDGYNKAFNFIISEREPGKSTALFNDKIYKKFIEEGKAAIVLVRNAVEITPAFIESMRTPIQKFHDDPIVFTYKQGDFKTGCVDVFIKGKRIMRILSMSLPLFRIKKLVITDISYIVMDEFIVNPRKGEKYLKDEAFTFSEIYTTFNRESEKPLKCYFCGNPYSHYNPYFVWLNADTSKLKRGAILTGSNWIIQCYEMKEELREAILKKNPLFEFDNSYTKYAFGGQAINDQNIRLLNKLPIDYHLRFVFKVGEKYISVWENNYFNINNQYYCNFTTYEAISKKRDIICFDFADLVDRTSLLNLEDRFRFNRFKRAMQKRAIEFSSIECYYLIEEIYFNL